MKRFQRNNIFIGIFLFSIFCCAQINPTQNLKDLPAFNKTLQQTSYKPAKLGKHVLSSPTSFVSVYTLYPGSLKENIQRLANQFGWTTVKWLAPYDYQWTGTTAVTATNLNQLLQKILPDFPLQAVFYQGNHILVIRARNIS